jgi:hypothetical protein
MAALEVVAAGNVDITNMLVATACWQALQAMSTPLLLDLALLLVDAGELQEPGQYSRLLEHYTQVTCWDPVAAGASEVLRVASLSTELYA